MEIEKNDMVMVYDGGGTVPHCKYTGRFGDLTAYWQKIVSDAVYLFRLGESEECDWLVLLGQPWSPYSPDGTVRVSSVETMHERRYTVDDWRYDTADCEQTENGQKS